MVLFKDGKNFSAFFVIVLVTGTLMVTAFANPLRIAPDAAVHLQAAKMILAGKVPYVDFFDRDPPLVSYLNIPATFIGQQMHQPLPLSYAIFVCLCVLASCILVARLLCTGPGNKESRHYPFLIAAYALFNFLIGPEFGTREHLLLLFCGPYLFLRFARAAGTNPSRKLALATGVAAGIGFNLDWIFLLYPVMLEIFYLIYEGKVRRHLFFKAPEIVSLLIVTAVYVLHFFFMNPTAFSNYVNIVAPLSRAMCDVADSVLGYVGKSPDRREVICIFMAALVLSFFLRKRCSLMMPLTIFAFTSLELYIYRSVGFSRDLLPLILACTLIITLSLSVGLDMTFRQIKVPLNLVTKSTSALIVLSGIGCAAAYGQEQSLLFALHDAKTGASLGDQAPFAKQLAAITNSGDRVLFLDGFERPAYPLIVQLDLEPGSKWLYEFPVRAFLKLEQRPDNPYSYLLKYKDPFYKQLRLDICEMKPKIVGVQSGEDGVIFDNDVEFKKLMEDYQMAYTLDCNYNLYSEYMKLDQHRLEVVGDEYPFLIYRRKDTDPFDDAHKKDWH